MLSCVPDHTIFLPPIASGGTWLHSMSAHDDASLSRMEAEFKAALLAVQRVEFPILGMTTQRGNTSVDDLDAEDELEEEEDEELDDIPDTDGEGFETDEVGT
ncbi:hypothetical protein KFE25_006788 [Diacronema lutheri]|uniref:Uncharacterized protein n=1 Tax=Diacronema lutheri TaxID=2081491 RepID=A0A8J6CE30_DIALT|nr:hypothetical protein KFE25_006788 [Diacronema lutheri]